MPVHAALRHLMLADPELAEAVKTVPGNTYRIWPMELRPNATLPAIVYSRVSMPRVHVHNAPEGDAVNATMQLDCWAADYDAARALFAQVRNAVDGKKHTYGDTTLGAVAIRGDRDIQDEDTGYYRVAIDLMVVYLEVT